MPAQSIFTTEHQGLQATLEGHLRAFKLTMFLEHYQAYAKDAARIDLSYERFLLALCEAETSHRLTKKIDYTISQARFPFIKEISTYDLDTVISLLQQINY